MRISLARVTLVLSLVVAAAPCFADVYSFTDEQGVTHFSDVASDSRYVLFMKSARPVAAPEPAAAVAAARAIGGGAPMHKPYGEAISRIAREQGLEPALLHAVITVESGYNARARSRQGASGLMQLIPSTAKRFGVTNVWNPVDNIRGGARYLRELLGLFNDNMQLAIAAYNAGEGAVMRSGNAIPPYGETRRYVPRVLEYYERYRSMAAP
ncbi:MAG: Lytic transglycosylase, catalytic [Betaproteobacteria bacterium]|nr:Lytic transglycosylase, catalytic [Betaproteobacteria bacterium]